LVAQWDSVLLSESLSLSLLALVLAAAIQLARRPHPATLVALVGLGALWSSTRDTNTWSFLPIALALSVWLLRRERPLALALALSTAAIVASSVWSAGSPQRWEPLMIDNVSERILADPSATQYFASRGMPIQPNLRRRLVASRRPVSRFDRDPTLLLFRKWMLQSGRETYLSYFLSHSRPTIREPLGRIGLLLSPVGLDFFRPRGFRSVVPRFIDHWLFPRSGRTMLLWLLLAATAGVAASRAARDVMGRAASASVLAIATAVVVIPLAVLISDGEPREVPRHELIPIVMSRLSLLALFVLIASAIWAQRESRRRLSVGS